MKVKFRNNIITLSNFCGVSGAESDAAHKIAGMFKEYTDEVYISSLGSVVAKRKGNKDNYGSVMIEAHMDEIGLMVTGIDDKGYVKFTNIGGIDSRILPGCEVIIHGKEDIFGVIGAKPPHLMTDSEMDNAPVKKDLFIDAGYTKKEAEALISVGDTITFFNETSSLMNDYISSKSLDDRCAVAILLDIFDCLKGVDIPYDIYFVASTMEETNGSGALTVAYEINPDFAIVIDVTHGDTPDASSSETYKTGEGLFTLCMGPNIHPVLLSNIRKVLDESEIKYELEIEGGNTGTNAWSIQVARDGIPCTLFSVPLRYMHTPNEVICIRDAKHTSYAVNTFLKSLDKAGDGLC